MARTLVAFADLELTNQCVVVCDLAEFSTPAAPAWAVIRGSQDDVGGALGSWLTRCGTTRFDDFGGVCEVFLCEGETYLPHPPRTKPGAAILSFTPKKRLLAEGQEMARVGRASGYDLLILTLQKHDKFGKVWTLAAALQHMTASQVTFYEDTNTIVDELKTSPAGGRVQAVHVLAPGFESHCSKYADRVLTQSEYRREVVQEAGA